VLTGKDDYRLTSHFTGDEAAQTVSKYDEIETDYVGAAATVGFSYTVSQVVTAGLVVETPTYLQTEQFFDVDTSLDIDLELRDRGISDYSVTRPFSFGFGLTGAFEHLSLTTDLHYTDWSQLDFDYDNAALNETPELLFILDNLKEVLSWHFGAEYLFPAQGVNLRAGYFVDPLPVDGQFIESQRKYFTMGAGFLLDRIMTVDLAYVHGGYELRDQWREAGPDVVFADQKTRRLFVTFAYRI
jgi:long-subunit fatty acid transport protein